MRYLNINKVTENMILGKPVYDENMCLLLGANKRLSKLNISKLKELGYAGVYVFDNIVENNDLEDVISDNLRKNSKESLRQLDIDSVIYYSNKIVEELYSNENICIDLIEMRSYDDYTYSHCVNVAILSTIIGIGMGLSNEELRALSLAGLLHDLGKTKIPTEILNKPDKLTQDEYRIVRRHAEYSYEIIRDNEEIPYITKIAVLLHHENENGTGYPVCLPSNKIYKLAKIIHVADVYDALTSKRPYKEAYNPSEALEFIMGNCDIMFHYETVETFIKYIAPYPIGIEVILSNGLNAIVVKTNRDIPLRPIVKTLSGNIYDLKKILNITIVKVFY